MDAVHRQLNPIRILYRYPWDKLYLHVLSPTFVIFFKKFYFMKLKEYFSTFRDLIMDFLFEKLFQGLYLLYLELIFYITFGNMKTRHVFLILQLDPESYFLEYYIL